MEVGRLYLHAAPRRVSRKAREERNVAVVASHAIEENLASVTCARICQVRSIDERDAVQIKIT
jgi:hypothetical protein